MTPSTAQSSFGSAMPVEITTSCSNNHVQLPVSRTVVPYEGTDMDV